MYLYYTAAVLIEMTCAICRSATLQKRMLVYAYTYIYIHMYIYMHTGIRFISAYTGVHAIGSSEACWIRCSPRNGTSFAQLCEIMQAHVSIMTTGTVLLRFIATTGDLEAFCVSVCVCACCGAFGVCAYAAFFLLLVSTPSLFCAMPKGESSPRNVHRMDSA